MLIQNNKIIAEKVMLTHMARGELVNPILKPNICYLNEERHALLKVPRVLVEFCINGTITRDKNFSHFENLVFIHFKDLSKKNKSKIINFWPTGTAFLGSLEIPNSSTIYSNSNGILIGSNSDYNYQIKNTTHEEKESVLNLIYKNLGTNYMRIASNYQGFQSTTWSNFSHDTDYLNIANIDSTRSLLKRFAMENSISNANSNYNYPVGRFSHRLCAFFMGFRLMAFNTYWCNYALDKSSEAISRFQLLYDSASSTLSNKQRNSAAWKIVELYTNVAIFIMTMHKEFFQKGKFGFEYLKKENFEPDLLFYHNFIKSGEAVGNKYGKKSVLESAEAYHFYRDKFYRDGRIDANHKLIKALRKYCIDLLYIKLDDKPKTIDDLLSIWIKIIDVKFPNFNTRINQLIKII